MKIQEKENYCVCAVLQEIFRRYNKVISQEEIADNLTPTDKGFFVDDDKIKNFLSLNGFEYSYYPYNATPFNEPDMLLRDMNENEGFVGLKDHIYLLQNFKDPSLELIDPLSNNLMHEDLCGLMDEMKKKFGFFGLVKYIF
jgi:hypothetical protein